MRYCRRLSISPKTNINQNYHISRLYSDKGSIKSEDKVDFIKDLVVRMSRHSLTLDKKINLNLLDINFNPSFLAPIQCENKRGRKKRYLSKAENWKNKRKKYSASKVKSNSVHKLYRRHKKVRSISAMSSLSEVKFYPLKSNKKLLLWDKGFIQKLKSCKIPEFLVTMKDI